MSYSRARRDDGMTADARRVPPLKLKSGAEQAKWLSRRGGGGQVLEVADNRHRYAGALGPLIRRHQVEQRVRDGFYAG
jgi:hypothetical protein